jgi:serine O-acetyltransferase
METSLTIDELIEYTSRQLNHFFPDRNPVNLVHSKENIKLALDRLEHCYKKVSLKHYFNNSQAKFNHLYSDHYVMYLWYLSNTIWKETADKNICDKLYYLNKTLHALDCMYDTNLPDIFLIFHGAGTMLGKASYNDYFVVLQGCTVGMNRGHYPIMQKGVSLTAHSSLIGNCNVGNLVTIASNTSIIDKNINDNTVVFKNEDGRTEYKETANSYAQSFFNIPIV